MRYLATITMLVLALAMVQPVAAQSFKPDLGAGHAAYAQKDYATALRHWRPFAEQGNAHALLYLGWMYQNGWGVTRDYAEAVRWYRKAAEQSHADAQFRLARLEKRLRAEGNWPPRSRQAKAKPAFIPDYDSGWEALVKKDYATVGSREKIGSGSSRACPPTAEAIVYRQSEVAPASLR